MNRLILVFLIALVFLAGMVTEHRAHLLQDLIESSPVLIQPVKGFIQRLVQKDMQPLVIWTALPLYRHPGSAGCLAVRNI